MMRDRMNIFCRGESKFGAVVLAALVLVLGAASAAERSGSAELKLQNASFEARQLPREGKQATNVISGWQTSGVAGVFVNNGAFGNTMDGTDGEQMIFLNGTKAGSLVQEVAERIAPNTV